MIKVLDEGRYRLIETKGQTKILSLLSNGDVKVFVWVNAPDIGEILVASYKAHKTDHILANGNYRMYQVEDEKKFTDLAHLELFVGRGTWQGYLLPTGLPTASKRRNRIIPTKEIITKSL